MSQGLKGSLVKKFALADNILVRGFETDKKVDLYESVEFSFNGRSPVYQYKIWYVDSMSVNILVREDSDVLHLIKTGDILSMKYNYKKYAFPPEYQKTAVRQITKEDKGRLKGHYLVRLEILESQYQ